ncbi:MAG TPA: hypothetical protein VLC10_03420 [Patescibacteria group bacterium]|nr:hypothetical protein [Patescibacteria group bacterium]
MGKYTKMALVLLYLLQLVIVFRDQLAHLYRSAMESVRTEADLGGVPRAESGLRAVFERVVQISRPGTHATLAAAAPLAATGAILAGGDADEGQEVHHDDDDKKDKARKHRHRVLVEFLLRNLWPNIRCASAAPSALTERSSDIIRVMLFSDATAKTSA